MLAHNKRYQSSIFGLLALAFVLAPPNVIAENSPKDAKQVVLFKKTGVYAPFPDLFKMADGTVVVTFDTRSVASHFEGTVGKKTFISKDGAVTWSQVDKPLINPILRVKDEKYVVPAAVGWHEVSLNEVSALEQQGAYVRKDQGKFYISQDIQLKTTSNGGKTWELKKFPRPPVATIMAYTMASYVNTSKGDKLMAFYGKEHSNAKDQVFLLRSHDTGLTWSFSPMFPRNNERAIGFNETSLCEINPGVIVAALRSDPDRSGNIFISESTDDGMTWSVPRDIGTWGYPSHLLKLDSKRLLITYGYRKAPMGIRARILNIDNLTPIGKEIVLRDDAVGNGGNTGYPQSVLLGNGKVLTVYYLTSQDGITQIDGTVWTP
jgi:Neuraminidase (sialidase)